jgi:hypothetical protein
MTWARRLISLARGDARSEELQRQIASLYSGLSAAARGTAADAEAAPDLLAGKTLRELAESQTDLAQRLLAALQSSQVPISPAPALAPAPSGASHWARLVESLEQLRVLRDRALELSAQTDELPELTTDLESLAQHLEVQVSALRRLIARADPQADD